jgi:ribosomal-protein-alanine N-acetyltransferase
MMCAENVINPFSPSSPEPLSTDALEQCIRLDRRGLGGFWTSGQWQQELERPGSLCLGQWLPGEQPLQQSLVGIASGWMVANELQLTVVVVDPNWRGKGLGRQLLGALLRQAANQGCRNATLEVAADNQPALGLYAALGFQSTGIRRGYYRNGSDALIQWLKIERFSG